MKKFDVASNETLALANVQVGIRASNISLMGVAFMLAMAGVLWVGGLQVIADDLTLGELTQFLAFMSILLQPVRQPDPAELLLVRLLLARAIRKGRRRETGLETRCNALFGNRSS